MRLLTRWIIGPLVPLALIVSACGGGRPTATVAPAATTGPRATSASAASVTVPTAGLATGVAATPTAAKSATPTAPPAQVKYGGTLRQIVGSASSNNVTGPMTNPKMPAGANIEPLSQLIIANNYHDFNLEGDLAASWQFDSTLTVLTMKLKPQATWSDGTPFTSKDVKYTMDTIANPPIGWSSGQTTFVRSIASIATPDANTVAFTLRASSLSLLTNLSFPGFTMLPSHIALDKFAQSGVGTGPFKPKSFTQDVSFLDVKNTQYWAKDTAGGALPYLDAINSLVVADLNGRYAALLAGQGDELNDRLSLSGHEKELAVKIPGIVIYSTIGGAYEFIYDNVAPFTDVRIRQATSLLIDRAAVAIIGLGGYATWDSPGVRPASFGGKYAISTAEVLATPGFRYVDNQGNVAKTTQEVVDYPDKWKKDPADIAKGIALLKDAGYDVTKGQFPWKTVVTDDRYADMAIALVGTLNKVTGIKLDVDARPSALFNKDASAGRFPVQYRSTYAGGHTDDPSYFLRSWITGMSSPQNYLPASPFPSKAFDDLYAQQDLQVDFAKRKETVVQMQKMLLVDMLSPMNVVQPVGPTEAWRPNVHNVPPRRSSGDPTMRELVWMDK